MLHPAANSHPAPDINRFLWPLLHPTVSYGHSCIQRPPQGHTSMASYGHPSLPFASPKTLKTLQSLINRFFLVFQLVVYHLSLSQRRPWLKIGFHRPFDGLFSLSWRHWPHSLCKRGKCKHTLSPSQRRPSQKTGSRRLFDGLFALSLFHWPHSLCKRGKCKHTLFPAQRRPWLKIGFHRPFDGLFSLSWRHWPHSLCNRGKCKHTLSPSQRLHHRLMVVNLHSCPFGKKTISGAVWYAIAHQTTLLLKGLPQTRRV